MPGIAGSDPSALAAQVIRLGSLEVFRGDSSGREFQAVGLSIASWRGVLGDLKDRGYSATLFL